jgi:alpha-galactosidase
MGAYVTGSANRRTLRDTPLTTRFNVSAFGCLGYDLDLKQLSKIEKEEIKRQITFYKTHRHTLQYGTFTRVNKSGHVGQAKENKTIWHCTAEDGSEVITGFFQTQATANENFDRLCIPITEKDALYEIATRPQPLFIKRLTGLAKQILSYDLNPDGMLFSLVSRRRRMKDSTEKYQVYGSALEEGILLNSQFTGSSYNSHTRMLGDFGSNLYVTKKIDFNL